MSNVESTAAGPETAAPSAGAGHAAHAGDGHAGHGHTGGPLLKLAVGAIGVVFGDIGTSPLYALRDTFAGHHKLPLDLLHIYGIISLMFWSMM
ncbi:MAG: KUP/HAK/KT family potassium transporter, partial [Novosphingobium sp.]|nr:KUP/HAK/KT family potassium transporter [Novosphingobium sp.]